MERELYMRRALELAREAAAAGEVPVGCVIVRNGEVVGFGRNRREEKQATASHAEMEAIAMANEKLRSWRLDDCELYVTLEPCPMCAGAILNARIPKVFYGARDEAMGACGGVLNLYMERFANTPALVGGILEAECRTVLEDFFRNLRK
jgi:tRNA(adenine34) deaminase